jgi:putative membrane protein
MVEAGGFYGMHGMHGFGFGLGFLNFIGTILFFVALFALIRFFIKGARYAGYRNWQGRGDWGRNDWKPGGWKNKAPWMSEKFWADDKGGSRPDVDDEAMSVARERVAQGEITPEQFETIKQGLKVDMSDSPLGRHDKAVHLARLRFAKGEISLEEFEAVKKVLS